MSNETEKIDELIIKDTPAEGDDSSKDPKSESTEDSEETVETTEPKERAGVILKRAREQQGLSLEVVHEVTKIPLDALRAIEEGYTVRMLSPFYYSGFVKMYANYLHVDVADVVEDYKQEELPEHIEEEIDEIEMPKWMTTLFSRERKQQMVIIAGVILALVVVFKVSAFLSSQKLLPSPPPEKSSEKVEAVKKEIKKATRSPRKVVRQQTPKIVTPKITPKKITPKAVPKVVLPDPKPVKPAASVAPIATIQKDVSLTVRANQNSWLRVKADGVVVFQSTMRRGAVETWLADSKIEISGRNINRLEFELNGKMIGTLGRKDRNAKKVVITKSGLSVKQ